ncbi:MAG: hypothetical protein IVW36_10575 [Dehalococcoidia bacterium]|nr:hypothetical protein [Dehalococcoidia bacterium]
MSALRIVYVHGIRGKPAEQVYLAEWDAAVRRLSYVREIASTMLYWSDIRLGVTPAMVAAAAARARERGQHRFHRLRPQTNSPLGYVISLGLHLVDPVIRHITKDLLTEVYLYFYGSTGAADIREVILGRMDAIMRERRPHVVIAHSWGSVIAYDYLLNRGYEGELGGLITMGSPLGQDYVQEHIGHASYPQQVRHWLNVFDAMDPATWPDRRIANDLRGPRGEQLIRDVELPSVYDEEGRRDPHSWYGYLISEPVQAELFRIAAADALWPEAARDPSAA